LLYLITLFNCVFYMARRIIVNEKMALILII